MIDGVIGKFLLGAMAASMAWLTGIIQWGRPESWPRFWPAQDSAGVRCRVLVARLEGDEDGALTRRIIESLRQELAEGGVEAEETSSEATEAGRDGLRRRDADLLVYGGLAREEGALRLRFLARQGGAGQGPLGDSLELPADYNADLGAALAISAAAALSPALEQKGSSVASLVEPAARRLDGFAVNPPEGLSAGAKACVWLACAWAEQRIGEERGEISRLEKAAAWRRLALAELAPEQGALHRAAVQNGLGDVLAALGERENGTERLTEAVAAYREALRESGDGRAPLDRAATQNNLGAALCRLGEREPGAGRFEDAVAAYREALKDYDAGKAPLHWAATQNNLGAALQAIGERKGEAGRLEEAVAAHREALKHHAREQVPLGWAMTQNNLGNALRALGEREGRTDRLEEAVAAYREALKEYKRWQVPLNWAVTQNNLGVALQALGEREGRIDRLEEAVAAYREALKERTRERVPLNWAVTQNNLGNALSSLGARLAEQDRTRGGAALTDARAALAAALEEFVRGGAGYYESLARNNLRLLEKVEARVGCGA